MATIGDPLMDLGTTLGYWVDPEDSEEWQRFGFGLTRLPGNLAPPRGFRALLEAQEGLVSDPVFYYAYGLLKLPSLCSRSISVMGRLDKRSTFLRTRPVSAGMR